MVSAYIVAGGAFQDGTQSFCFCSQLGKNLEL